jgi:hypothetical protein
VEADVTDTRLGGKRWALPLNFLNLLLIFTYKEIFDRFSN